MKTTKLKIALLSAFVGTTTFGYSQNAELQVIHNSADPAAAAVDVYLNGNLILDDFAFREATSFQTLPAGVPLNIGIAPGSSTSANDTLKNFTVSLISGEKYIAVANGVINPANFASNPDNNSTSFGLTIIPNAKTSATQQGNVEFIALHGSTDAPTVDIKARGVATLVDNADFGAFTPYIAVPAADYILDITPGAGSPIIISYQANLSGLAGGTAVVFASGFLNPATNQSGAAFGLFAALADGTVIELQTISQARLQVIHNAADPAASAVDIYVNGDLTLPDFGFRTATPYLSLPAGVPINIGVAPGSSMSVNDTLKNFTVTLENGETYAAIANGVLNPGSFVTNPDGRSTGFTLLLQNQMKETADNASDVNIRVVHGATDAPTVDVFAGVLELVNSAAYTDITPYLTVPAADYVLDIKPAADNSVTVASYSAPLSGLAGKSITVLASGFLNETGNNNGQAFTLIAVLADGTVLPLELVTSINSIESTNSFSLYPNPSSDQILIDTRSNEIKSIQVVDIFGKSILNTNILNAQTSTILDVTNWESGMYEVIISAANGVSRTKFIKI
ncbi:MAG: DUF4397 domain-containing protein [Bacteroidia bacterium]|nr:DUF4397 domain-containing protein [Bacteroidia bacterium]